MGFLTDPERRTEPKEPETVLTCEECGCDICLGDTYYHIPVDTGALDLCEDCGWAWLRARAKEAERDD